MYLLYLPYRPLLLTLEKAFQFIVNALPSDYIFDPEPESSTTSTLSTISKSDILSLPTELFEDILISLDPLSKAECLRLSKEWKRQLRSKPILWRDLRVDNLGHKSMGTEGGPIRLFTVLSRATLTSVELDFHYTLQERQAKLCFHRLGFSCNTLKRLRFQGWIYDMTLMTDALSLASRCVNLESFAYSVNEDLHEGPGEDEDDETYDWDNYKDDLHERHNDLQIGLDFDQFDFKSPPLDINLTISTQFAHFSLDEKADFFRKAEKIRIEIDYEDGKKGRLDLQDVAAIMKASKNTLKELVIVTEYFYSRDIEPSILAEGTEREKPIHLPRLEKLQIPGLSTDDELEEFNNPISILAPLIKPEDWVGNKISKVISNAGSQSAS